MLQGACRHLACSVGKVMEAPHHPSQLTELVLSEGGLEQGALGATIFHHLGHVLQVHLLAPLQVVYVPRVGAVQLIEEVVNPLRGGIREQLLIHLQDQGCFGICHMTER